ncbi:hypothetical protein PspLS_02220 [Pyricularia sp. CBS 133598]|nr:hypothetical protein PspLS_02220 [Pyricularia sp. CBS 133598]
MGKNKAVWQAMGMDTAPRTQGKSKPTNVGSQRMSALTPTATLSYPSAPQKPRDNIVYSLVVV